jgi:hypothetical protein
MPTLEELMRRALEEQIPSVNDELFHQLQQKRRGRHLRRRIGTVVLTVAVLAATAGGFVVLRNQFAAEPDGVAGATPYGAAGLVAACPVADGTHLCVVPADSLGVDSTEGRRLLTEGAGEIVAEPDVSPDGTTVVFERFGVGGESQEGLWTIHSDGSGLTQITELADSLWNASWSPDGSRLIALGPDDGELSILLPDGTVERTISVPGLVNLESPRWAPDGSRIAFKAVEPATDFLTADIFTIAINGSELVNLTETRLTQERDPAWSPDGTSIAYTAETPDGPTIHVRRSDGSDVIVSGPEDDPVEGTSPDWSPDGRWLAYHVSERVPEAQAPEVEQNPVLGVSFLSVRAARVDGSRDTLLAPGVGSFGWIPQSDVPPTEPSPEPEVEGRDIGLGFRVCFPERLGRVDFLGDGTAGSAWTGVPVREDGTCPAHARPIAYILAVDHTGDQRADTWIDLGVRCDVLCTPFDAADLDGNGTEELVVASHFSIMSYYLFSLRPDDEGNLRVEPILVADPGHAPADITAGEPLRIDAGGDEGYGSSIQCEGFPEDPVIVWAWRLGVVDSDAPREVHETRIELQSDGLFHVVGTNDSTVPAGEPGPVHETAPACGVDWHPAA